MTSPRRLADRNKKADDSPSPSSSLALVVVPSRMRYQILVSPPASSGGSCGNVLDLRPGENWIRLSPDPNDDVNDEGTVRPELVPVFAPEEEADSRTCFLCLQYHRGLLWARDVRYDGGDNNSSNDEAEEDLLLKKTQPGRQRHHRRRHRRHPNSTWRAWWWCSGTDGKKEILPRQAVWLQHGDRLILSPKDPAGSDNRAPVAGGTLAASNSSGTSSSSSSLATTPAAVPRSVWLEFRCNDRRDREKAGEAVLDALARVESAAAEAAAATTGVEVHRQEPMQQEKVEAASGPRDEGVAAREGDYGGSDEPRSDPSEGGQTSLVYTVDDSSLPTLDEDEQQQQPGVWPHLGGATAEDVPQTVAGHQPAKSTEETDPVEPEIGNDQLEEEEEEEGAQSHLVALSVATSVLQPDASSRTQLMPADNGEGSVTLKELQYSRLITLTPSRKQENGGEEEPAVDEDDDDAVMSGMEEQENGPSAMLPASQDGARTATQSSRPAPHLPCPYEDALLTQPPELQSYIGSQTAAGLPSGHSPMSPVTAPTAQCWTRNDNEVVDSKYKCENVGHNGSGDDATVDPDDFPPAARESEFSTKDSRARESPHGRGGRPIDPASPGDERGGSAPAKDLHLSTLTVRGGRQRDEESPSSDLSSQPLLSPPPSAASTLLQRHVSLPIRSNQHEKTTEDLDDKLEANALTAKPPSSIGECKSGLAHSPPLSNGPAAPPSELAEGAMTGLESGSPQAEAEGPVDATRKRALAAPNFGKPPPRIRSNIAVCKNRTPGSKEPVVARRSARKRSPFVAEAGGSEFHILAQKKQNVSKGWGPDFDLAALAEESAPERPRDAPSCVVLTTSIDESVNQKVATMVTQLRGELISDIKDAHKCTHLIASDGKTSMKRTPKLMIALCKTSNIVSLKWLQDSGKAGKLLDTRQYLLLNDLEAEKAYSFTMSKTLARVKERQRNGLTLLGGRRIYVCPTVFKNTEDGKKSPPAGDLKLIVSAAGGHFVEKFADLRTKDARDLVVITNSDTKQKQKQEAQKDVSNALLANGAVSKSLKSFLHLMMTQDIDDFL